MNVEPDTLARELSSAFDGRDPHRWLWAPLLRLIAHGEPVAIADISHATGRPDAEVRQALSALPDTEYDDEGRVVGSGLTMRPTTHQFEIDGRTLYTWCALDTLVFPAILGKSALITSRCHATGEPVHLSVTPTEVTDVDPETAVVSIVSPDDLTSVRSAFCNQVHFFASVDAAHAWFDVHPGGGVMPVAAAFALGRELAQRLASSNRLGSTGG